MHIGHIRQSILCHLESNLGFRFLNSLGASEIFACNLAFRTLQCSRTTKYFIILWEKILNSFSPWNLLWFMRVDASLITLVSHQFKADHKLKHLMIFFFFFLTQDTWRRKWDSDCRKHDVGIETTASSAIPDSSRCRLVHCFGITFISQTLNSCSSTGLKK